MSENPLVDYFRRPALYITLPSNGKFYPEGAFKMPETGEVAVYPMTAIDEITYRTPDALFNGSATADVIQSCVPAIKNAWEMPGIDLTTVLTAIRIASLGPEMDITTTCPQCGETADYGLDLRHVLAQIGTPNFDDPLKLGELEIFFKPLRFRDINENNKINAEEKRLMYVVRTAEGPEDEKIKLLTDAFKKVSQLTLETISKNIAQIVTPNAVVDDYQFIYEFVTNCENDIYKAIKNHIIDQRTATETKPLHIKCSSCGHEYEQPYTLDMSNFFESNS